MWVSLRLIFKLFYFNIGLQFYVYVNKLEAYKGQQSHIYNKLTSREI